MRRNNFDSEFIPLADVYLAYRKAKSDAYYDNLHPSALAFSEFEQDIQTNIEKLHRLIIKGEVEWWEDLSFIGGYLYVPKSVNDSIWNDSVEIHYRSIDPSYDWEQRFCESGNKRLNAVYRLIITPTVEYQIVSALWILKVGHKLESKLNKNLSYGNRLRRRKHLLSDFGDFIGPLNSDSLGLFAPYFSAYRNWRQKGLDAMRRLVEAGKPATAVTMDLAGFYHNASPNFLLKPNFLKMIGVELTSNEKKFTQLLLDSINCWYRHTPDYEHRTEGALPVGLSSSKVISNVLLYELDKDVNEGISPAYYGRYVDDVFLVFETPENITNGNSVVEHLANNIESLKNDRIKGKPSSLKLKFGYASDSDLRFSADKQKIFSLSSEHGLDLINQISSQIRAQSSEYRMLPEVPRSSVLMAEKALLASPDASLIADALRKADVVSIRRLGLSLLLRDIESYSSDLSRADWSELRQEFYGLVHRYLLTPKGLFELFNYYHRVFSLMVANYDFSDADKFIVNLTKCFDLIERTTVIEKGRKERIHRCKMYFGKILVQTTLQASTSKYFDQWQKIRSLLKKLFEFSEQSSLVIRKPYLARLSDNLLFADLGARPYKDYWYYSQEQHINKVKVPKSPSVRKILRLASIRKFRTAADLKLPHWPALAFPTRPLSIQEIALTAPKVLDDNLLFRRSIFGLRGAKTLRTSAVGRSDHAEQGCYHRQDL